ncbi:uncharacterized protein LOC115113532 [Oncorhynchus nerka]|uniref:uncharacterized protein LOC115113532 n=1 Tax=Oncorhynchus nerka TaxID=8023 RepID=UPI0031B83109
MDLTIDNTQHMSSVNLSVHRLNGTSNHPHRQCWLYPDFVVTQVKPWLYLALSLLGFLANSLTLHELWRSVWTPTIILTLNMVTSDLLLCTSFLFRVVYYRRGHIWSGGDKVRPRPALLTLLTRSRGCWVLCLITWVTVATVVSASVVLQIGRGGDSFFDMLENHHREEFNNQHCLRVVLFFTILTFILVGYGGLVLHLQSVRGARNKHTSEGGVTEVVELRGGRGVCGVFRGGGGQGENRRGVDLGVHSGAEERQGVKGGSLRVRRKILAAVVVFVACFLPYHVQRAVTLLSPHGGDCEKGKT